MTLHRGKLLACTAIGCLLTTLPSLLAPAHAQSARPAARRHPPPRALSSHRHGAAPGGEHSKSAVAVTALSSATLKRQNVVSQYDLNRVVPLAADQHQRRRWSEPG